MRVFVTGASGFVGSAVVRELLSAGHEVLGMVRSDSGAAQVVALGAEVYRGDIYDLDSIRKGPAGCDAVIHMAFDHDFSKFKESCEHDRKVIQALADGIGGPGKPLVVTSGIGLLTGLGRPSLESDIAPSNGINPRRASEEAAIAARERGVDVYLMRLPPSVHGAGDHGFVPLLIGIAKEKQVSAYIGEGNNQWPAVHRFDAARLYRLVIERKPSLKTIHAAAETGIPFREVATAIGKGLQLPVEGKYGEDVQAHFTWFSHFAAIDCETSSAATREATGWKPQEIGLLEDMVVGGYFQ